MAYTKISISIHYFGTWRRSARHGKYVYEYIGGDVLLSECNKGEGELEYGAMCAWMRKSIPFAHVGTPKVYSNINGRKRSVKDDDDLRAFVAEAKPDDEGNKHLYVDYVDPAVKMRPLIMGLNLRPPMLAVKMNEC